MSAGIVFRQLSRREAYGSQLGAFTLATLLGAGPWLLPAAGIALLTRFVSLQEGGDSQVLLFQVLVLHALAFSLVGVGAVQTFGVRYLSDCLFAGYKSAFTPTFVALLIPLVAVQVSVWALATSGLELPWGVRITWLAFYAVLHAVWLAIFMLGAVKDYLYTSLALAAGTATSVVAAIWGWNLAGLAGEFAGLTFGYGLTFSVLLARMIREFGYDHAFEWGVWTALPRLWPLFVAGTAYMLGLWADKFLFWAHPSTGVPVIGWLHHAPAYDNAVFLATLTIVPALGALLMQIDGDFYERYRDFFSAITRRGTLSEIETAKVRALSCFRTGLAFVMRIQVIAAIGVALLAAELLNWLGFSWLSLFAFRFGVLAMVAQLVHLVALIVLLYFDRRRSALAVALSFLVLQAGATWWSLEMGAQFHGVGTLVANALTAILAFCLVQRSFDDLEFDTFMRQPT